MSNFQSNYSSVVRGIGPKGEDMGLACPEIRIVGSGLVGTCIGVPGFTATLIGTGLYSLVYPRTRHVEFEPQVQAPTGQAYSAFVESPHEGISGVARLSVLQSGAVHSSGLTASGLPNLGVGVRLNPPTGTIIRPYARSFPVTAF